MAWKLGAENPGHSCLPPCDGRSELAVLVAGSGVYASGVSARVRIAAGPARTYAADYVGCAHHDFRGYFHIAGSADTFDRSVCESVQLFGAVRSQRDGVAEA